MFVRHDTLRPEEQFGRAQHERVLAAIKRISQDHVNKVVHKQRWQVDGT